MRFCCFDFNPLNYSLLCGMISVFVVTDVTATKQLILQSSPNRPLYNNRDALLARLYVMCMLLMEILKLQLADVLLYFLVRKIVVLKVAVDIAIV